MKTFLCKIDLKIYASKTIMDSLRIKHFKLKKRQYLPHFRTSNNIKGTVMNQFRNRGSLYITLAFHLILF